MMGSMRFVSWKSLKVLIVMVCSLSLSLPLSLPRLPCPPSSTAFLLQPPKTNSRVLTLSAKDEPLWLPLRPPNSREQQAVLILKPLQGSRCSHKFLTRETLFSMQRCLPADVYTQEHMKHMLKTAV